MSVTIYGASDDCIEVDGDIRAEFAGDCGYIATSTGVLASIEYAKDGCWRIFVLHRPDGVETEKVDAIDADSSQYSDRLTIHGDVAWVAHSLEVARWAMGRYLVRP
jgi:hypothetical protein